MASHFIIIFVALQPATGVCGLEPCLLLSHGRLDSCMGRGCMGSHITEGEVNDFEKPECVDLSRVLS